MFRIGIDIFWVTHLALKWTEHTGMFIRTFLPVCIELLFHWMLTVFWSELIIVPMCVYVCVCVCVSLFTHVLSHVWLLCYPMDHSPPGSSVHGDSPGKNTRVGCHSLLQGLFPAQGSNPGLLHWQMDSLPLHHWSSPTVGTVLDYLGAYYILALHSECRHNENQTTQLKNGRKTLIDISPNRTMFLQTWMANNRMIRCRASLITRKMQVRVTMR